MEPIRQVRDNRPKIEVDAFYAELNADRSALYYHIYRAVVHLDDMRVEMSAYRNAKAAKVAKKFHTTRRRADFNRDRDILVLKLLDSGRPYVCAVAGCGVNAEITVDHIVALSRGGSDELVNLQFLCRPHNSEKGDRDSQNLAFS